MFRVALIAIVAFSISLGLSELLRRLCTRCSVLDHPNGERWHRSPRPRLGGVAIFAALVISTVLFADHPLPRLAYGLLAGAGFVFVWGLIDDFRRLRASVKFVLLIVTGIVPPVLGISFPGPGSVWGMVITAAWVTGVTNAMNWFDNMDGAAAGVATLAATGLFALSVASGNALSAAMACALAGATLGFLTLNVPPARIFMGDSGSGLLGYSLATIAVLVASGTGSPFPWSLVGAALFLCVPLLDMVFVTIQRVLHRRPIFLGGTDHLAHRLVVLGLSEREVVAILYALGLAAGAAGLLASQDAGATPMIVAGFGIPFLASIGIVGSRATVYAQPSRLPEVLMTVRAKIRPYRVLLLEGSLLAIGLGALYAPIITDLVHQWRIEEDQSHGPLIALASAYLLWRQRAGLRRCAAVPSWHGYAVILVGIALLIVGKAAVVGYLMRVSLLVVLAGLVLFVSGPQMLRLVTFPLTCLLFTIPLPYVVFDRIALPLQFLASNLATSGLDVIGIPALREGNIITLSSARLGVTEACSGIRSLMALLGTSIIYSHLSFPGWWRRVLLVASTVPIAILTNAARVAVTGMLAEGLGHEAAMGFYHTFSGLLIFGVAATLLMLEGTMLSLMPRPISWRGVHVPGV